MAPFSDTQIELTAGQIAAINALNQAKLMKDEDAVKGITYHMAAWDKHYGRPSTLYLAERKAHAMREWEPFIFSDGGGI